MKDGKLELRDLAQLAHENNRYYCALIGDPVPKSFDEMSEDEKFKLCNAVQEAYRLIDKYEVPEDAMEASHNNWLYARFSAGWKYGPVKDEEKKEHPNLVPYEKLPFLQRCKDSMFITFAAMARYILEMQSIEEETIK